MARKKDKRDTPVDERSLSARRKARRESQEPVEVRLSLGFRFGEEEGDKVSMLENRSIPMVGSVFQYRDRIIRNFAMLMLRAGVSQPKVVAEILPTARWLRARKRAEDDKKGD